MADGVTSANEDKSGLWTHAQVTQGQYTKALVCMDPFVSWGHG